MSISSSGEYEQRASKLLRADRAREALEVFEEGARRFPGDEDLLVGAAMAKGRLGDNAGACDILEAVRARNPRCQDAILGLVDCYLARGMDPEAAKVGFAAAQDETDAKALSRLARVFYSARRWALALPHYEAATRISPEWGESWFGLGACLWAMGKSEAAEDALRHAVALEPRDWQARQYWGCVLHDMGRKAEARAALEAVPLDAEWQKPALERLVAMAWWPGDPERKKAMESLWAKAAGRGSGAGLELLEEVGRKLDA